MYIYIYIYIYAVGSLPLPGSDSDLRGTPLATHCGSPVFTGGTFFSFYFSVATGD